MTYEQLIALHVASSASSLQHASSDQEVEIALVVTSYIKVSRFVSQIINSVENDDILCIVTRAGLHVNAFCKFTIDYQMGPPDQH
jgi:hypothetical protein